MLYNYFVVSHVYPDYTEAELFSREEMEEKSWVVSYSATNCTQNPLLHLNCGDFDMYIDGFKTLEEAEDFMDELTEKKG